MELVTAPRHYPLVTPWNPWRALRARTHLRLEFADLPDSVDGLCIDEPTGRAVVLATRLDRRARAATLAHELVHDERGLLYDQATPPPLIEVEERIVHRTVAERLVPPQELAAFVERCLGADLGVTAHVVAEEFDVPADVAQRALDQLVTASRSRHPARRTP